MLLRVSRLWSFAVYSDVAPALGTSFPCLCWFSPYGLILILILIIMSILIYHIILCHIPENCDVNLLFYFPFSEDPGVRGRLNECLETILNKAQEPPKSKKVQHSNAKNAVLFEAISLIIHNDTEPNLLVRACNQLGQFLSNRETNLRYLALESMCLLATSEFSHEAVKKHQEVVILSMKVKVHCKRKYCYVCFNNSLPFLHESELVPCTLLSHFLSEMAICQEFIPIKSVYAILASLVLGSFALHYTFLQFSI